MISLVLVDVVYFLKCNLILLCLLVYHHLLQELTAEDLCSQPNVWKVMNKKVIIAQNIYYNIYVP